MQIPGRSPHVRRNIDELLRSAHQLMQRGDYAGAETVCRQAMTAWRGASLPRSEENIIVSALGKCYEAQRKYEQAYELYMESLPHLRGNAYNDVYNQLLYLNEKMGTFHNRQNDLI